MNKGWKLLNEGKILKMTKDAKNIRFDQVIDKNCGHLCGVKIMRRINPKNFRFLAESHQRKSINYAHQLLGYPSLVKTIAAAKYLGWMVDTADLKCIDCQMEKQDRRI